MKVRKKKPLEEPTLVIIVDTREQLPFSFPGTATIRHGLRAGDYSVLGFEDQVAVERKSLADLYGTVGKGRDRFERELEKLAEMKHAAIVIESTWYDITRNPPERSEVHPRAVLASLEAWEQRYGVSVHAYGRRALAERLTFRKLERFWRDALSGKEW